MQRAFTLLEAMVTVVVVVMLAASLLTVSADMRRNASRDASIGNLKWFAVASDSWSSDNNDQLHTFTWQAGEPNPIGVPSTDVQAAADQAVSIIRSHGGHETHGRLSGWLPHVRSHHLVLLEHQGMDLRARRVLSPEDRVRQRWQDDGIEGRPVGGSNAAQLIFSSSYRYATAACSTDTGISQHGQTHANYFVNPGTLGPRHRSDIRFSSRKALIWDSHQRHYGARAAYFAYPEARIPMLLADGSATVRTTSSANEGFKPFSPTDAAPTLIRYFPAAWEPPSLNTIQGDILIARYAYTRSGLRGRDFGAPEVPWQP